MHYCPACGSQLSDDSRFCDSCGAKQPDLQQPQQNAGPVRTEPVRTMNQVTGQKSRLVAGLLGIFLGWLGIHNFYLGYTVKGLIQLCLGVSVVGSPISWIWGFIEGIFILSGGINQDGQGRSFRD
jgi:TM2 domain-containing membrane protein YozV